MKKKNSKAFKQQLIFFYKKFRVIEGQFYNELSKLEEDMQNSTGIEDIEFFAADNEFVGIGNITRTMRLVHFSELDKILELSEKKGERDNGKK